VSRANEWADLAGRLAIVNPDKHDQLLECMRAIVRANELYAVIGKAEADRWGRRTLKAIRAKRVPLLPTRHRTVRP
jgi:hypothetical protein